MAKKNPQIVANVFTKGKRVTVMGVREMYKNKDIVNLREFTTDGDDLVATKAGFTIPAENFKEFFNSLRKFGRTAGLLPKAGEDAKEFQMLSLEDAMPVDSDDEGDDDFESTKAEKKAKKSKKEKKAERKAKVEEKTGIQRRSKKETAEKDDADSGDAFSLKAFKKAIKAAVKNDDDMSLASDVVKMYKTNRKKLEDLLPKHAVNALNKSIENKKDESFLAKAVAACQKHIIEKDFTL